MIHDGLAENGHYYTYVFDRALKVWWKLNDHNVSQEREEIVLQEAFGGDGYKSACNIIYICPHIIEEMDQYKAPLYTPEHARQFQISKQISDVIKRDNYQFDLGNQSFIIE